MYKRQQFDRTTHCVNLTQSTIEANKRFFASEEDVPRQAYTMGIKTIMQANKILMVASLSLIHISTGQTTEIQNPDAASVAALGEVTGMSAAERGSSGALLALKITYEKGSALVRTEYNIRKVLGLSLIHI